MGPPDHFASVHHAKLLFTVRHVMNLLVSGRYAELEQLTLGRHLCADDFRDALHSYHLRLIESPPEAPLDIVEVLHARDPQWHIVVDLWTASARTDLSLEFTVTAGDGPLFDVVIDGLHVR